MSALYAAIEKAKQEAIAASKSHTDTAVRQAKDDATRKVTQLRNHSQKSYATYDWVKGNYVGYNQELGIQGTYGCGNSLHGHWLSTYRGPFVPHSDEGHENTRWFIRKRCGGCDNKHCTQGKCFDPVPRDTRASSNASCPY